MNQEKRATPRFLFPEPVAYGQPEISANGSLAGNISLGGISLKVQEFVPLGAVLELQINLGLSQKVVWIKAKVVRIRQISSEDCFEVGLRFIKDAASIKEIGEYISSSRSEISTQ